MTAAGTAAGTGGLGDGRGFAGDAVEDWRSAGRRGGDGRGEGPKELGVGCWWCDGCLNVLFFLLDDVQPAR